MTAEIMTTNVDQSNAAILGTPYYNSANSKLNTGKFPNTYFAKKRKPHRFSI